MKSISLSALYKQGIFNNISRLRKNTTGYYYVTLLHTVGEKTTSSNIYFGKKTAELIDGTFQVGDSVSQFLKHGEIVQSTNKDGDVRFKISTSGSSNYSSEAELNEIWGENTTKETIDLELFKKEFEAKTVAVVEQD